MNPDDYIIQEYSSGDWGIVITEGSLQFVCQQRPEVAFDKNILFNATISPTAHTQYYFANTRENYELLYQYFQIPEEFQIAYDTNRCLYYVKTSLGVFDQKSTFNEWEFTKTRPIYDSLYISDTPKHRELLKKSFDITFEVQSQSTPCPDCKGTGQYIGFSIIEPCRSCNVSP